MAILTTAPLTTAKVGMWNKADPAYVPQYAAFYLLLGDEYVDQQRKWCGRIWSNSVSCSGSPDSWRPSARV